MWKWLKWVLILILLLVAFGFVKHWFDNKNLKPEDQKKKSDSLQDLVSTKDLPTCPANISEVFSKPFMDGDKPDFITPLGSSGATNHIVPVDHVYPSDKGYEKDVPVYAPGDMTLVWVENKQMHNKETDAITRADYQLNFAPCRGLNLALIHLWEISPKLREAIGDENSNCSSGQKMDYGTQEGVPTYYQTCHPDFKKIRLAAGELVGYFSGHSDRPFSNFDIGLYDYNKSAVGFVNPDRYYDDTNHTVCFADYYMPELKAKYYAKLGGYEFDIDQRPVKYVSVIGEPKCGKVNYDQPGTASGDWFRNTLEKKNFTDNQALVLIHDNIDRELAKLSLANVASFTFPSTHSGKINREYSEVKADGQIYCYSDPRMEKFRNERDKNGNPLNVDAKKFLIQLVDETHLKLEAQSGFCADNEKFNSPEIYER